MKVAVTGGSGFIGSYVLRSLEERRIRAVATTHKEPVTSGHVSHRFVHLDLAESDGDPYLLLGEPQVLIHLAWGGLPNYGSEHHVQQVPAHVAFLGRLIEAGLPRLLVAGTCMEYGLVEGELSEDDPIDPANPYAAAKNQLREQLEVLKRDRDFALTWARLFYTYGHGQAPTSLYSSLERASVDGIEELDMSDGEQLRDFLPVETVADLLVCLALDRRDIGVVNVSSGEPVRVRAMAERWIRENGWSVRMNLGARSASSFEPTAFWGNREKLDRYTRKEGAR